MSGMNKPVSYSQLDQRWRYNDYSAAGEQTTIGASGCGPTSMAMVLATWADQSVTPATECAWALKNGYKAPHQGTYYGYFVPAAKRYSLTCKRVNLENIYGMASSPYHAIAKAALEAGNLVIACMGKGNWTRSGHYVVPWKISGDTIYINDPASTKLYRTQGDYSLFKQQVKYYWIIEAPHTEQKVEEDEDMTQDQFNAMMENYLNSLGEQNVPDWAKAELQEAIDSGITDGERPMQLIPRYQSAIMAKRAMKK